MMDVASANRDDARPEGHGPDELEPLDEHSEERQEPEDDYYIKNYVLKEAPESEHAEESVVDPELEIEEQQSVMLEAEVEPAPERAKEPDLEAEEPPAFGSKTFGPPKVESVAATTSPTTQGEEEGDLPRAEHLEKILSDLLESSPYVEAAALVSLDGLAMAAALPDAMMEDRVAAMSAAILGLGERASAELGRGALNQVFVEGDNGYVFLMSAGGKAVLTALAGFSAKIGLVFYDMKHAAAKIADVL